MLCIRDLQSLMTTPTLELRAEDFLIINTRTWEYYSTITFTIPFLYIHWSASLHPKASVGPNNRPFLATITSPFQSRMMKPKAICCAWEGSVEKTKYLTFHNNFLCFFYKYDWKINILIPLPYKLTSYILTSGDTSWTTMSGPHFLV